MGGELEREICEVITYGIAPSFPRLTELRRLRYYATHAPEDSVAGGAKVLRRMLDLAATEFDPGPRSEAIRALLALDLEGKRNRALNGEDGLRQRAGSHFGIGWDQFGRTRERELVADFARWVEIWDRGQSRAGDERVQLGWPDVEHAADSMFRLLEREFAPDVVVTMSGPGSFAAIYTMRLNPRDVPVLVAVTFPFRDTPGSAEHGFRAVATKAGWNGISTSKWSVFVPDALTAYPPGSRVVILDDRVITGETQVLLRRLLEQHHLEVRCAALFAPRETAVPDLLVGRLIDGAFDMPWGSSRGRT